MKKNLTHYYYQPHSYSVRSGLKQGIKQITNKRILNSNKWQSIWLEAVLTGVIKMDLLFPVVFYEHEWFKNPLIIMPESDSLIQRILSSNFEGQVSSLHPVEKIFSIAIPKNTTFNKKRIHGIFVAYSTFNERTAIVGRFSQEFSGQKKIINTEKEVGTHLCITYENTHQAGRVFVNADIREYSEVLSSRNISEYHKIIGNISDNFSSEVLSSDESQTQYEVVRFVIALIIYMSAHKNSCQLIDSIKMRGAAKYDKQGRVGFVSDIDKTRTVRFHYRNLRNEKYYQGVYEDWEAGSRWVPVNMIVKRVRSKKEV